MEVAVQQALRDPEARRNKAQEFVTKGGAGAPANGSHLRGVASQFVAGQNAVAEGPYGVGAFMAELTRRLQIRRNKRRAALPQRDGVGEGQWVAAHVLLAKANKDKRRRT